MTLTLNGCKFCRVADDGTVACWHLDATRKCDVTAADIYLDDGVTVILHTPNLGNDQRLHVDTPYCPMCGRRREDENAAGN